ncbi:hypothetical protein [Pseudomonas gingeri]|nr:hypothetical protein [Pseudomonas gingeri]
MNLVLPPQTMPAIQLLELNNGLLGFDIEATRRRGHHRAHQTMSA